MTTTPRIKPKTYGPLRLDAPSADQLHLRSEAGFEFTGARTPGMHGLSPSDLLLASLATCVGISMRMAAEAMGLTLGALQLSATATKALDAPNRFERLDLRIHSAFTIDAARSDELLKRTKALCTVSNTLGAEVGMVLVDEPLAEIERP
ncbi:MAG: OsmC family protein [Burkholderiales bacterium]|nr:OsmC family protein [Burkholderiales bacterium]